MYAQVINDDAGCTLVQANSLESGLLPGDMPRRNVEAARAVGKAIGERAKAGGVSKIVFDRGGHLYRGRVRAVAEGAREAGLDF